MPSADWSTPNSYRPTLRARATLSTPESGLRRDGSNRLDVGCGDCGAVRYERCFKMRTIYSNPREHYRFYLNTIHKGRTAKTLDNLPR